MTVYKSTFLLTSSSTLGTFVGAELFSPGWILNKTLLCAVRDAHPQLQGKESFAGKHQGLHCETVMIGSSHCSPRTGASLYLLCRVLWQNLRLQGPRSSLPPSPNLLGSWVHTEGAQGVSVASETKRVV